MIAAASAAAAASSTRHADNVTYLHAKELPITVTRFVSAFQIHGTQRITSKIR